MYIYKLQKTVHGEKKLKKPTTVNCRFFKMTQCNKLPACELILIKAYLVASAILNLEMENHKKEFQFQTKISFNNQHNYTCSNSPKNSLNKKKKINIKKILKYKQLTSIVWMQSQLAWTVKSRDFISTFSRPFRCLECLMLQWCEIICHMPCMKVSFPDPSPQHLLKPILNSSRCGFSTFFNIFGRVSNEGNSM